MTEPTVVNTYEAIHAPVPRVHPRAIPLDAPTRFQCESVWRHDRPLLEVLAEEYGAMRLDQLEVRWALTIVAHMHDCSLRLDGTTWKLVPLPPKEGYPAKD